MPIAHFLWPAAYNNSLHCLIALGEGLRALGWTIQADGGNWTENTDGRLLFEDGDLANLDDADLVIADSTRLHLRERLAGLSSSTRRYKTVGVDMADVVSHRAWYATAEARELDLVLRCHSSARLRYPSNVRPWAFGLSERMIHAAGRYAGLPKENRIVWNFNHRQYPHTTRLRAAERVPPNLPREMSIDHQGFGDANNVDAYDHMMWEQTGKRHSAAFYERLATSRAVACFGGWFLPWPCRHDWGAQLRLGRAWKRLTRGVSSTIVQWDSWRWWEALLAESVAVHFDFDHYGFRLPVMPVMDQHYVGINLSDINSHVLRTLADELRCAAIGTAGRAWAIEYYSPSASARRLLDWLGLSA